MLHQILMTVKGLLLLTAAVYGFAALLHKEDAAWVKRAPLQIFVSMFVIGMWGHNVWVVYIASLLALPILARSRADAAALYCIMVVSLPLLNQKIFLGSLYLIPLNKYVFSALGLAIACMIKRDKAVVPKRSRFDLPIILIMVLELTQARDPSVTATIRQCIPVIVTILVPYVFLSRALNTPQDVRRFLLTLALAGFVMAVVATAEARLHWLIYKQIQGNLNIDTQINAYMKMRAGMVRAPASFVESTSLGTFLAIAVMAVMTVRDRFASRAKWLVALFFLLLGLMAANSRGAFVSVAIGAVAWDFYCRRYGALSAKVVAAGLLYLFALTAAQFSAFFAAMVGQGSGTEATTEYRYLLLRRGLEEIRKHPLLGQTLDSALANLQDLRQGEGIIDLVNGYINYGLTLGYPGMVGLVLVFISLSLAMLAARRRFQSNGELLRDAACVFSSAVFSILNSFFTGFGGPSSMSFYQVCALGAALWAMRRSAPIAQIARAVPDMTASPGTTQPSGIAALIAADRERARTRGQVPA